jgi:hypothetical protein
MFLKILGALFLKKRKPHDDSHESASQSPGDPPLASKGFKDYLGFPGRIKPKLGASSSRSQFPLPPKMRQRISRSADNAGR